MHLTFSPDGRRLAAALWSGGLRVYARDQDWVEAARDEDYGDSSYGAAFAPDGRLATTSCDGKVRLYAADLQGRSVPIVAVDAPGGHRPLRHRVQPADGARLAVGYYDSIAVTLLDGHSLAELPGPDVKGIANGDLSKVAWSLDGQTLFAAGSYQGKSALRFSPGAMRAPASGASCPPLKNTVMSLVPLPDGDLLVAAARPLAWQAAARRRGRLGAWAAAGRFPQPVRHVVGVERRHAGRLRLRSFRQAAGTVRSDSARSRARPAQRRRHGHAAPGWPADRGLAQYHPPDARRPAAGAGSVRNVPQPCRPPGRGSLRAGRGLVAARLRRQRHAALDPAGPRRTSGRSTSPATAGWWWPPTATARSAGTG